MEKSEGKEGNNGRRHAVRLRAGRRRSGGAHGPCRVMVELSFSLQWLLTAHHQILTQRTQCGRRRTKRIVCKFKTQRKKGT